MNGAEQRSTEIEERKRGNSKQIEEQRQGTAKMELGLG